MVSPLLNNKKKRIGLFQLFKEIFIAERLSREIEKSKQEMGKNLMALRGLSDPVARLKCLEETEKYFNKGKALMYEMKERQTFLPSFEARQDAALESELEDWGALISGLRIINKIAVEGYLHGDAIEKWTELLTYLGFNNPKVMISFTLRKLWKIIIIKDPVCRQLDDLPPDKIKKQQGIRKILERMGGKFYYKAAPSFGTRITVMLPSND
ncbi:MAG: ATP-binding protein [Candidatus Omnitrophota bacterium]|nr:ATP-binding protein [Candidatus Omnitrophota bacterium]